jgi:Na+-transporting NADH:ubiquinone oxidoreductase subunit NqrC
VAVHKIKETLKLDKTAYVGMSILDISKTLMYDFHYNNIKKKYKSKAQLLFTDTNSLTYEIETKDVYKDFWKNKSKFDFCDYPENSPFYDKTNKKVIGKFKDEAAGEIIKQFVGLRSKMYSYIK